MENGEWGMGNGEWGMGNGEWGTSGHRFFQISTPNFNCNPNPNLGINPAMG